MTLTRMLAIAGFAVAALGASTAADAQGHGHADHRGHDGGGRGHAQQGDRHDAGHHYGWRNGRGHHGCYTQWRHHHRERICR